jgi:hypothetical protein
MNTMMTVLEKFQELEEAIEHAVYEDSIPSEAWMPQARGALAKARNHLLASLIELDEAIRAPSAKLRAVG